MNNFQIEALMNKYNNSKAFQGCYSSDDVQDITPNTVTIYNTESGYQKYGHWTVLFTSPQLNSDLKTCIYFDSLGDGPKNANLVQHVLAYSSKFLYNNIPYQSIFSQLCGLHAVFVSALYCQGVAVHDILTKYYNPNSNKELLNDKIVFYTLLSDLKKLEGGKNLSSEFVLQLPFNSLNNHGL